MYDILNKRNSNIMTIKLRKCMHNKQIAVFTMVLHLQPEYVIKIMT